MLDAKGGILNQRSLEYAIPDKNDEIISDQLWRRHFTGWVTRGGGGLGAIGCDLQMFDVFTQLNAEVRQGTLKAKAGSLAQDILAASGQGSRRHWDNLFGAIAADWDFEAAKNTEEWKQMKQTRTPETIRGFLAGDDGPEKTRSVKEVREALGIRFLIPLNTYREWSRTAPGQANLKAELGDQALSARFDAPAPAPPPHGEGLADDQDQGGPAEQQPAPRVPAPRQAARKPKVPPRRGPVIRPEQLPGSVRLPAQVKGRGSPGFAVGGRPNIEQARASLRTSRNGSLAIEDANLSGRQPKVFFATDAVVQASNARLKAAGSHFVLELTGRWFKARGSEVTLREIIPRNITNDTAGYQDREGSKGPMVAADRCNEIVKHVMGSQLDPTLYAKDVDLPGSIGETQTDQFAAWLIVQKAGEFDDVRLTEAIEEGDPQKQESLMDDIAAQYTARILNDEDFSRQLEKHALNEYAPAPEVGGGMVTFSLAKIDEKDTEKWPFHYGGVVAKDGEDYVTLENYARAREGGEGAMLYYFQMYGPRGDSWHEKTTESGQFNSPLSVAIEARGTEGGVGDTRSSRWEIHATKEYGGKLEEVKGDYPALDHAASLPETVKGILKGLAYALGHATSRVRGSELTGWKDAVRKAGERFPEVSAMAKHTQTRLEQVRKKWFSR